MTNISMNFRNKPFLRSPWAKITYGGGERLNMSMARKWIWLLWLRHMGVFDSSGWFEHGGIRGFQRPDTQRDTEIHPNI